MPLRIEDMPLPILSLIHIRDSVDNPFRDLNILPPYSSVDLTQMIHPQSMVILMHHENNVNGSPHATGVGSGYSSIQYSAGILGV